MKTYDTEDEAIKAAESEVSGYIDFDGNNCADCEGYDGGGECAGWDGKDHRCDCGNRRVTWVTSQNKDGKWYAYAEAY